MIWCAGLLLGRSAIPEAPTMRKALQPSCSVDYYSPSHEENPTKTGYVNDLGVDEGNEGQWSCVLTAPHLQSLAHTFDVFAATYMGVGKEMRDNFFYHEKRAHKFIFR